MDIVYISWHHCGRALKQAEVLGRTHDISLITNRIPPGHGAYKRKIFYEDPVDLENALDLFNDKYIFHVHNEPSWMVYVVRKKFPKARIVFDVHDSNYWRMTEKEIMQKNITWYEEEMASMACDAYIFPSESAQKSFPKDSNKPSCVVPSANPLYNSVVGKWDYIGGLCSQGAHVEPSTSQPWEKWRDYTDLYAQLRESGIQVHAYSAEFGKGHKVLEDYYINLGAKLHVFSHKQMIGNMGRHNWSLTGNLGNEPVWRVALPNKFFDSMSAIVPVVNFGVPEVAKYIDKYDVGINVKDVAELKERWGEFKEKRMNVYKALPELSMEHFVGRIEKLYKKL